LGEPFRLFHRQAVTLGRDPANHIVLPSPMVSRFHAVIRSVALGFAVFDAESTNGTFVNGACATDAVLEDGATIGIGPFELEYRTRPPDARPRIGIETAVFAL